MPITTNLVDNYREEFMRSMREQEQLIEYSFTVTEGATTVNPSTSNVNEYVKVQKQLEMSNLQQFIDTGSSDLQVLVNDKNTLQLYGFQGYMASISSRTIKAHKARTKHLIKQLTALAERERLRLEVVDDLPERRGRRISFWLWKNGKEVDDSALVTITKSVTKAEPEPERPEPSEIWTTSSIWTGANMTTYSDVLPF